jgi:predicted HTH transcriptional regulator
LASNGKVVTFGNADGGYALMPLNNKEANKVLGMQSISKEQFMELQHEAESLEMAIAKGEDTPEGDKLLDVIEALLSASPWTIDPDSGQVVEHEALMAGVSPALGT